MEHTRGNGRRSTLAVWRANRRWMVVAMATLLVVFVGCGQRHFLRVRPTPWNPLAGTLRLLGRNPARPSERAIEIMRRYGVLDSRRMDLDEALLAMQQEYAREPTWEKCYVLAELAYLSGWRVQQRGQSKAALDRYAAAVTYAYSYLFDPQFDLVRHAYDPLFRQASDIYNMALEACLRIYWPNGQLTPANLAPVRLGDRQIHVELAIHAPWRLEDVERIEFVSDYQVEGLSNRHHSYGLGVPLIVVRKSTDSHDPAQRYYPPGLSFAATAILRVNLYAQTPETQCTLELYDTVSTRFARFGERIVPLEADLSTPLAYFMDTPEFNERIHLATLGLINPQRGQRLSGIFMVEPFHPDKIPVLLIHGLWSSPATWMEMFNDLRSFPEIGDHYQFWFYQYPTGQPFWISAAQLREDLHTLRNRLDPYRQSRALDFMVLVGHSMGGLVARLQTIDSGDDFWHLVSHRPLAELHTDEQEREELARLLFFHANPSVRRVITIGTPHRGSNAANPYTRWLARRLIRLPQFFISRHELMILRNPGYFRNTDLLTITTSIDSLAPNSPVLLTILQAQKAPWVRFHNVVGLVPNEGLLGRLAAESDGVVNFASAHLPDAESEVVVNAHHLVVHQHPRTILEVRRILLDNLSDYRRAVERPRYAEQPPPLAAADVTMLRALREQAQQTLPTSYQLAP